MVRASQMVKLVQSITRRRLLYRTPRDDIQRPFTQPAPASARNCQTYDIPFSKAAMLPGDMAPSWRICCLGVPSGGVTG